MYRDHKIILILIFVNSRMFPEECFQWYITIPNDALNFYNETFFFSLGAKAFNKPYDLKKKIINIYLNWTGSGGGGEWWSSYVVTFLTYVSKIRNGALWKIKFFANSELKVSFTWVGRFKTSNGFVFRTDSNPSTELCLLYNRN